MNQSCHIFIIDDCATDIAVYRQFLAQDNQYRYEIYVFSTALVALEHCQHTMPDLIILDFMLSDINGLEFLGKLKLVTGKEQLPVIMITRYGDENIAVQAMKAGVQDYLVKGKLTCGAFLRACHTVLERLQFIQQIAQQQEQQKLLGAIALRIRQSLSLEAVLNTTVDEVRKFLKADRVLVYRLQPKNGGVIVAESVWPKWRSCLNIHLEDNCFARPVYSELETPYRSAVTNIREAGLSSCYVQMLESFQVKAKIVVPIFSYTQSSGKGHQPPWGLLIAHQCSTSRQWQESEIELLDQLSVQIAIAIQQAELYQNLKYLNTQLEANVQERTKELQSSERKFRAIFEQIFQYIFLLDPHGLVVEVNQSAIEYLQLNRHELIGKPLWDVPFFNRFIELKQYFHQGIKAACVGQVSRYELTLPHGENREQTLDFSIKPILGDKEKVIFLLVEARDITQHKNAESALQKLNQELEMRVQQRTLDIEAANKQLIQEIQDRKIIEAQVLQLQQRLEFLLFSTPGAIYTSKVADEYGPTFMSGNVTSLFGYDPAEFITNSDFWFDHIHPEDQQHVLFELEKIFTRDRIAFEYRLLDKQGVYRWVFDQSNLVRDEQGNPLEIIGYWLDISDRKLAELEIIQNRDLLKAIFNESTDAMFLVDAKSLAIIDCNQRAVELFEFHSKDELVNTERLDLLNYQFSTEELKKISIELNRDRVWNQELEYTTCKGNLFWGSLAAKQISVAGRAMNLIRVSDITNHKQAEVQIKRSLEEKETLLKEIHHRVKNNLQIISSLLRMQSRRSLDSRTAVLFEESQNRVQSMALIHEQLYQSPNLAQIDFHTYITNLTDNLFRSYGMSQGLIRRQIETNNIYLSLDVAVPCGLIINELVSNSLKYAFLNVQNGKVTIHLHPNDDHTVTLSVSDNGIGIPENLNWENSRSLGLRIVNNLTRQLKGNIRFESNCGTSFHITFAHNHQK
ncbi:signal transduction histidine kinase [Richelia sinica FACHB-800]|uniref:Signal transduction histidine kinase n=1 Tax=Richelia sinica FACHB-800 TaxID=1357546 RepID=A0A975T923_9NOST|nr:PAS domain S-box protein [Richelia sinica]MBD2663290.1 PAS domain S-box protein [Richelia sinica FACHB-800]QXE24453.1 signal transduction histidine kinase [Richelia sinica FACHB-800]